MKTKVMTARWDDDARDATAVGPTPGDRTVASRPPEGVIDDGEDAGEGLFGSEDDAWDLALLRAKETIVVDESPRDTEGFDKLSLEELLAPRPIVDVAGEVEAAPAYVEPALDEEVVRFMAEHADAPARDTDDYEVVGDAPAEAEVEVAPVEEEPLAAAQSTRRGEVIVLFGCRGGAGATTLAVNTAGVLAAQKQQRVCVVDLDLQLGDVFVALDLEPKTSIAGLARDVAQLDGSHLQKRLQRHECGFYALSQTGRIDEIDPELPDKLGDLFEVLRSHFDVVLIDGVRDFGDYALAALDAADQIVLVVTQDVPAVRRAARIVQLCRKLKYPERKLRVVVNRAHKRAQIGLPEIERALGVPVRAQVANDYRATLGAQNAGRLLHTMTKRSRLAHDIEGLAESFVTPLADDKAAPPGFWARLTAKLRRKEAVACA